MRALLMAGVSLGLAAALIAQQPARDQPKSTSVGSASMSGVVVDDENQAPLRRATLTLSRTGIEDIRIVATGDDGRFVFDRLPAGSYTLGASKGAYVSTSYGAPKPGMPGSAIVLTDGQAFVAKPIVLLRGAVIAGRLTDRLGLPIANSVVHASQFVTVNGERRSRGTTGAFGTALVNVHGEYRIYGLMPGDYVVYTTLSSAPVQGEVTADELTWANRQVGPVPPPARLVAATPTIFPGTPDPAAGVVISLARGEERLGVDFPVQSVPVSRVTGKVTLPDGRPATNAAVLCSLKHPGVFFAAGGQMISAAGFDGAFACFGLPPGQYVIAARLAPPPSSAADAASRVGLAPSPGAPPPLLWGFADVTVTGADISNVAIQVQPGLSVSGQATFKAVGAATALDPTRVQVRAVATNTTVPMPNAWAMVRADGTFQIDGIVPGSYRLISTLPPPTDPAAAWTMRSAMLAGRDVADMPFDVFQHTSGLVVTFSNAQIELSGVLTDSAGLPAPQLYVFVFPVDKTLWIAGSRRVQSVRSAESGAYRITGLPPGDYYLCALTELDTTLQTEPSYLEQFVSSSIKITLGEGEKKTQDLRVGR